MVCVSEDLKCSGAVLETRPAGTKPRTSNHRSLGEREGERERQTDRQTETERQRERERQRNRETERESEEVLNDLP